MGTSLSLVADLFHYSFHHLCLFLLLILLKNPLFPLQSLVLAVLSSVPQLTSDFSALHPECSIPAVGNTCPAFLGYQRIIMSTGQSQTIQSRVLEKVLTSRNVLTVGILFNSISSLSAFSWLLQYSSYTKNLSFCKEKQSNFFIQTPLERLFWHSLLPDYLQREVDSKWHQHWSFHEVYDIRPM